jgi:RNA recognition motif-containing protein
MRDNDLELEFSPYGSVQSAKVMMDRDTNRSKGFGFVEMSSAAEAEAAIAALNGKNVGGRDMTVNIARPMEPRSSNGGGGFRDSYGSGRRSY